MPGPTTRVLALLELLQTHGRLSGADIAARLDVDRRTVRRYITALEDLGIPVTTEQGRYGGYMLVAGFKLPPLMFNDEEALVLALGLLAVRDLEPVTSTAMASAQAKLERVLPEPLKHRLRAIREHTQVLPTRGQASNRAAVLLSLTEAAQAQRRVMMRYSPPRGGEPMQRAFEPYGLVLRGQYWYVSGYCPLRQDLRSFRLDRLADVVLQEQQFQRPGAFDAAEHLQETLTHAWSQHAVTVVLHTDIANANEYLPHIGGQLQQRDDGVLLTTTTDSLHWFIWWLLRLPCRFSIESPAALKGLLRQRAQRLLAATE